ANANATTWNFEVARRLDYGELVSDTITNVLQTNAYSLYITNGDTIGFQIYDNGPLTPRLRVLNNLGTVLFDQTYLDSALAEIVATYSGFLIMTLSDGGNNSTGSYQFKVTRTNEPMALNYGMTASAAIELASD